MASGPRKEKHRSELLISVDIEASGPVPPDYSMLSIGACVVDDPAESFYVELKPIGALAVPEAMKVLKRTLADFKRRGVKPRDAMLRFKNWVAEVSKQRDAVFV